MMTNGVTPIPVGRPTFLDAPRCTNLDELDADIAILGLPVAVPYSLDYSTRSSLATQSIREQSLRYVPGYLERYDFDFGGELLAGKEVRIADCGDVTIAPGRWEENCRNATSAVRTILSRGAMPIVLGGEHSVTIPVLRAYEERGPICIVHVDAHIDWRDEVNGIREGLSSPMRRASEMPWIKGMVQVGIRGIGSARRQEFDAARKYGSVLIGAEELHRVGVEGIIDRIPSSERYYISFDADGLDPAIAPAVMGPAPGGVTYYEATNLFRAVAKKGYVVGMDFVEVLPSLDVHNLTSRLAVRLILNLIGALAHAGRVG